MKKLDFEKIGLKENGIFLIILSIVLFAYTREIKTFLSVLFATVTIFYIPGYAATFLLLKDWDVFERIVISPFIGLGITPAVAYLLSVIGLKGVSGLVTGMVCILSIAVIIYMSVKHEEEE